MKSYDIITILGPTASGKTAFAAALAKHLDAEIISADSRQVYRRMDIGTGKDFDDYRVDGALIPYHLIDICEPGAKYNLFEYQRDFIRAYRHIKEKGKLPILCGGTGLYIESVLQGYKLLDVPQNPALRESLKDKSLPELEAILSSFKTLHNKTDVDSAQRAIRAIEIETYYGHVNGIMGTPSLRTERSGDPQSHINLCSAEVAPPSQSSTPPSSALRSSAEVAPPSPLQSLTIGIQIDRTQRRQKISNRLQYRLANGMIDEVRRLLESGIPPEDLIYYGLEYKFLTRYIIGEITYDEMAAQLEIAIHQFAKRQMTWFRGMERRGHTIHWLDASLPTICKIKKTIALLSCQASHTVFACADLQSVHQHKYQLFN